MPVPEATGTYFKNACEQMEAGFKLHMDKTLRFWVDCSYETRKANTSGLSRHQVIFEILHEYEADGFAMRCLDRRGHIFWKATPMMLTWLADAEREAEDDLADMP